MHQRTRLTKGIAAGLGAGVFWGLGFVAPKLLPAYSAVDIALGRFFFCGLASLLFLKPVIAIMRTLSLRDLALVFAFSASGFWLYTTLMFWSVQLNDTVITAMLIGLLPITIALAEGHIPAKRVLFAVGLASIAAGLCALNLTGTHKISFSILGVAVLSACHLMWLWYAIYNGRFLKRHPDISKRDFTSLLCIFSLLCMVAVSFSFTDVPGILTKPDLGLYLVLSIILGMGSTWVAYWLWNICSAYCPPQISGPLLVSETVFAILFSLAYQQRLPSLLEFCGILLFAGGAIACIRAATANKQTLHN